MALRVWGDLLIDCHFFFKKKFFHERGVHLTEFYQASQLGHSSQPRVKFVVIIAVSVTTFCVTS